MDSRFHLQTRINFKHFHYFDHEAFRARIMIVMWMNENIHTLFHFHCQTYCVNISPAEEKDLCNYEFVPLLPFPTLHQHPEKDGACGKNDGYHYDDDNHDSESCNDGNEELKTAIRKMREGPTWSLAVLTSTTLALSGIKRTGSCCCCWPL